MTTTLIIGCGYVGEKVARSLRQQEPEHVVIATTGTVQSAAKLARQGIAVMPINFDTDELSNLSPPRAPYRVLYLVPPPKNGEQDTRLHNALHHLRSRPPLHIAYMGTSGVYGDCQGAWVDEARKPHPISGPSKRRLHAERILDRWCSRHHCSRTLLRVSAIYGPERLPIKRIREGNPIVNSDEAPWTNRIHIEDLTTTCIKALERQGQNEIFNVSDGNPTTSGAFISAIARTLGMPPPPTISLDQALSKASPTERIYLTESRRLDNRLLIQELGVSLQFPTIGSAMAGFHPVMECFD